MILNSEQTVVQLFVERNRAISRAEAAEATSDLWLSRYGQAKAEVDRLRQVLINIDALDPQDDIDACGPYTITELVLRMGELARDALQNMKEI